MARVSKVLAAGFALLLTPETTITQEATEFPFTGFFDTSKFESEPCPVKKYA